MATKTELAARKNEALESLRNGHGIVAGSRVFTFTDYVGNAGTAYVRVYIIDDNRLFNITWLVANAIGDTPKDREGKWMIKTTGYGYNRAQHVADALSWALFGKSGKIEYIEH